MFSLYIEHCVVTLNPRETYRAMLQKYSYAFDMKDVTADNLPTVFAKTHEALFNKIADAEVQSILGISYSVLERHDPAEFDYHGIWDALIGDVISELSRSSSFKLIPKREDGRVNAHTFLSDPSELKTTTRRCDETITAKNVPMIRGEEKKNSSHSDLKVAQGELIDKLTSPGNTNWSPVWFSKLPFTFAYSAAGSLLRFHATLPNLTLLNLLNVLDLHDLGDCKKVWCTSDTRVHTF